MNEITAPQRPGEAAQPWVYADRRALSEAWYSALYDAQAKRVAARGTPAHGAALPSSSSVVRREHDGRELQSPRAQRAAAAKPTRIRLSGATAGAHDRARAQRRAQPAASLPRCRNAAFRRTLLRATLANGGRVDLLVQQRGDVVRLVAIYDGRGAQRVADALHRAQAALLQRGVRTHIDAIRKGTA